jgi:phospholipase C
LNVTLMPRRWLLAAIPVTAALALAWVLPGSPATAQRQTPIRHVVVIYLENHSFDNVLGYWCDSQPGRCPNGGMPSSVKLSNGAVVVPSVSPDTIPSESHTVASQLAAMNIRNGVPQMNGWQNLQNGTCAAAATYGCISGYKAARVPNLAALAGHFAISDMTFSMADSPSFGGHLYAALASLDNFTGDKPVPLPGQQDRYGFGCDSGKVAPWIAPDGTIKMVPSCVPDYNLGLPNGGAFEPTPVAYRASIFDRLSSAGLSWRIYGGTTKTNATSSGYLWSICPSLAECLYTNQLSNLVDSSKFVTNATAGNLPAFSIVTAGGANNAILKSCHNSFSMTACDNYIGQLVGAVEKSPDWASTAVFITFDDFGGFYDQVPPGLNPDGTQRGPRVPLIIVSPYAKPGYTDTTPATFASILAYTEQTFGLTPLGVNDTQAYPFANAFNYAQAPRKPVTMVSRPLPPSARRIHVTPALRSDPS